MPRREHKRLEPKFVDRAKVDKIAAGSYADGDGLYLIIEGPGYAKWIFKFPAA
jgi:hypothetical protein